MVKKGWDIKIKGKPKWVCFSVLDWIKFIRLCWVYILSLLPEIHFPSFSEAFTNTTKHLSVCDPNGSHKTKKIIFFLIAAEAYAYNDVFFLVFGIIFFLIMCKSSTESKVSWYRILFLFTPTFCFSFSSRVNLHYKKNKTFFLLSKIKWFFFTHFYYSYDRVKNNTR